MSDLSDALPLGSLRAFALVGKHLSISRAAEELEVTPSAISHHIRTLEQYVDVRLLARQGNKIELTATGKHYLGQITDALLLLSSATTELKSAYDARAIRVVAPPSVSSLWLVDRVTRYMKLEPATVVTLTSASNLRGMLESGFDIGVWFGEGAVPGMQVTALDGNRVFPICHPQLLEARPLTLPDLARVPLLQSGDEAYYRLATPRIGWRAWLRAVGGPDPREARFVNFTPHLLMHRAVEAKFGVGLSRTLLAVDGVERGTLVLPLGMGLLQRPSYQILIPGVIAKRADVVRFRDYLIAEADASVKSLQGRVKVPDGRNDVPVLERRRAAR